MRGAWKGVAAAGVLATAAACRPGAGRLDAPDRELPEVRRAIACEQAGDVDGALAAYEEALLSNPRAASAHLGAALLLHDSRQNYIEAIYHYRRYLALRPGTQKEALIGERLRVAQQLLAVQCARRVAETGGESDVLYQQVQSLQQRLSQVESEKAQLSAANDRQAKELAAARAEVARLQRWVDRLQVPDSAGAAGTAVAVPVSSVRTALAEEAGLRTYEVQQGDSLSRIAEKVYGDPTQWPRIRDANRDKVRDERVRAGQVLVIP